MKDIIWLQGHPAIAAIHYYQHLKNTHVFYCPDDITTNGNTPLTIRALARDILKVYDSVRPFHIRFSYHGRLISLYSRITRVLLFISCIHVVRRD